MASLNKRWYVYPRITPEADQALSKFPPVLRQILFNRGYPDDASARWFLKAEPPAINDPFLMLGVRHSVDRIIHAIEQGEKIAVYGDYDVDGVTATALLVDMLEQMGAQVEGYIPNRFEEGYGLNNEALSYLKEKGVSLVITVDCGVRSPFEATHAQSIGLDMIITDHHQPAADLPPACAIVNPKQPGDVYPDKDMAGVGLAYKLACALLIALQQRGYAPAMSYDLDCCLDLVALGTVADLAPLTGENRSLVRAGLRNIREGKRCGILSLSQVAGLHIKEIGAGDIGFMLGPRLNAAGRIDSALDAFQLLRTRDVMEAAKLAQMLDDRNRERQKIMHEIQEAAETIAMSKDPDAWLLFAVDPDFNSGVIGLAASRLMDSHYRPAIVATRGEEFTRGSCRSIGEFHITEALDQCADLLVHHGGHAAAAGFTVHNDNVDALITRLKEIAAQKLSSLDLRPMLTADAEVRLKDMDFKVLEYLDWLQPVGYGNPMPTFVTRNAKVTYAKMVGAEQQHLKLTVESDNITFGAICFRQGQREVPPYIDIAFMLEKNTYNGYTNLQLNVKDFKASGIPD